MEIFASNRSFGGWTQMFSHSSESCSVIMKCSIYLPPQADTGQVPVLYWLSGLTCTHENFISKAGAQQFASELGVMLVIPDTSPRGAGIDGEEKDFGAAHQVFCRNEAYSVLKTAVPGPVPGQAYGRRSNQLFPIASSGWSRTTVERPAPIRSWKPYSGPTSSIWAAHIFGG